MNSLIALCQTAVVAILLVHFECKLEVKEEDPQFTIGTWFHNLEKKLNVIQDEENRVSRAATSEQDLPIRKRKLKNKRHRKNKLTRTQRKSHEDMSEVEKIFRRNPKKKHGRSFVKTSVDQFNNSDSSESMENGRSKPVDIIVHIKMKE